ncbi:MAG TPA: CDC27 family protein [Opitutales bacterium]|nr:CDC27 family protein [Opitutales bacterium]
MRSEAFKKMVAQAPENRLFRFSLGQALFDENSPAEAAEHLEFCCDQKEDWMMPRILLGKAYLQLGKKEEAREILQAALQLAIEQNHEGPEAEVRALLEDTESRT